jgi:small subunit ribosomal protein S1
MKGIIPRIEGAVGIDSEMTRDIALITRVNRPVCFIVTGFKDGMVLLSRKQAQLECIAGYTDRFKIGDIIPAKITCVEQFVCYADIGCGIIAMILISDASVSLILNMSDRFYAGQEITAAVKSIESWGVDVSTITGTGNHASIGTFTLPKITLTHKELLGTWEENAALFAEGETVIGIVRSIENYGVFIELLPNLVGLAELGYNVKINQTVSVYIKAIIPEKMKIKLIIIDTFEVLPVDYDYDYFIRSGRIDKWAYSTCTARKVIKSEFG